MFELLDRAGRDVAWPTRTPSRARHITGLRLARATGKARAYKASKGWTFLWCSSYGSDFNYHFHITMDDSVAAAEYNYRTRAEHDQAGTSYYFEGDQPIEAPGTSFVLRSSDDVFHT